MTSGFSLKHPENISAADGRHCFFILTFLTRMPIHTEPDQRSNHRLDRVGFVISKFAMLYYEPPINAPGACTMRSIVLSLFLLGLMASGVHAEVLTVDSSIGDGMVLQQDRPNPISGRGTPGASVDVVLVPGTAARTQVDASGRWAVAINPGPADEEPRRLSVNSGNERLQIADVMIGELWFCSGQSNMVWSVDGSDRADEFRAAADNSMIRMFTVGNTSAEEPREDLPGRWVVCSPETVGRFSAVAYHFGKQLQQALDVPIGLVNSSWGGSRVEAWMRPEALEASGPCGRSWQAKWQLALDELHADPAPFADSDVDDSDWIPGSIPGHVNAFGIEDGVDGIFWHRVPIEIPPT